MGLRPEDLGWVEQDGASLAGDPRLSRETHIHTEIHTYIGTHNMHTHVLILNKIPFAYNLKNQYTTNPCIGLWVEKEGQGKGRSGETLKPLSGAWESPLAPASYGPPDPSPISFLPSAWLSLCWLPPAPHSPLQDHHQDVFLASKEGNRDVSWTSPQKADPFQRENLFIWKGSLLTHSTGGARLVGIGKGEGRAKEIVGLSFSPKKQRREDGQVGTDFSTQSQTVGGGHSHLTPRSQDNPLPSIPKGKANAEGPRVRNYISSGAGAPGCLEALPGVTDHSGLLNFIFIKTKS